MKYRWLIAAVCVVIILVWLSRPETSDISEAGDYIADAQRGEQVFHAGGCASCHGLVKDGKPDSENMGGGLELHTFAGIFRVPNISPHPQQGIGEWSAQSFVNAMRKGVSPDGRHYYPAFPYTSYTRMTTTDLLDLQAYLLTTPMSGHRAGEHDLGFPWSMSWTLGIWKRLFLDNAPVVELPDAGPLLLRGQYLVEGPGHCAECHTPRNLAQALNRNEWMAGAPEPEGKGRVPNITPHGDGLADWAEDDIAWYLETGVDPEFDVVGGSMVSVQENMARLSEEDRKAIAAYLKAIPALARP